jgi:hypothetical protein
VTNGNPCGALVVEVAILIDWQQIEGSLKTWRSSAKLAAECAEFKGLQTARNRAGSAARPSSLAGENAGQAQQKQCVA